MQNMERNNYIIIHNLTKNTQLSNLDYNLGIYDKGDIILIIDNPIKMPNTYYFHIKINNVVYKLFKYINTNGVFDIKVNDKYLLITTISKDEILDVVCVYELSDMTRIALNSSNILEILEEFDSLKDRTNKILKFPNKKGE